MHLFIKLEESLKMLASRINCRVEAEFHFNAVQIEFNIINNTFSELILSIIPDQAATTASLPYLVLKILPILIGNPHSKELDRGTLEKQKFLQNLLTQFLFKIFMNSQRISLTLYEF